MRENAGQTTKCVMVLIIDDDPSVRLLTERLVKNFGFRPLLASDGEEGLRKFEEHAAAIRVVVLDLTMPSLDGVETCARLRKLRPDVPILFTSGYEKRKGMDDDGGLTDFLQKPFTIKELQEKLAKLTGSLPS